MDKYLEIDEWKIIEQGFDPERQRSSESIFSIGNGHMGQRANFEESYSGDSLQGSYVGGIYYPDKTKVGWWKNGYPEYFAKVLNSVNWIGIDVAINGQELDLAGCTVSEFERTLNMKDGLLKRSFKAELPNGDKIVVNVERFISMSDRELGVVTYKVSALNFDGTVSVTPYINGEVYNEDANYDEQFWEEVNQATFNDGGSVTTVTKKLDFYLSAAMKNKVLKNGELLNSDAESNISSMNVRQQYKVEVDEGDQVCIQKFVGVASSFNHNCKRLHQHVKQLAADAEDQGFEQLRENHRKAWAQIWDRCDVQIEGDAKAQQGIRFNIFQLYQTYTGDDERLNIGPKGFTGEKYGGCTYWDTEAYCLPFYMNTADRKVSRNLLEYRYRHLPKAIENAEKLGFSDGAALYPMVTMNGEECHNEWEITFEEVHRNAAIAYAIYNYIEHTGDDDYLLEGGMEVLVGICRFWAQRFNFSEQKQQYVMLGVTGPNEYENNINNNWYTSYAACWCMNYTMNRIAELEEQAPQKMQELNQELNFEDDELKRWKNITEDVFLPESEEKGIFLQQENYLDKEQRTVDELNEEERPLNQNWSWDRILRSCFIKQGDVIQGLYFFEDHFDEETIRQNFDFYEPRTVHESSLSPCIHAILASSIGYNHRAYELYMRTARLDLDDYNEEVHEGLHITSMAGTWMTIVEGFAGKRIKDGRLHFSPTLPEQWGSYSFKILHRGRLIRMEVSEEEIVINCEEDNPITIAVDGDCHELSSSEPVCIPKKITTQ